MTKGLPISRTKVFELNLRAIEATDKHFAGVQSVRVAGTPMTPQEIKAVLQAENDAMRTVDATRALLKQQIAMAAKASKRGHELRQGLRTYVLGTFGPRAIGVLSDFRFAIPKPKGPKKLESKRKGLVAAKATREARHTMGKRQKQKIKGTPSTSST